MGCGSGQHEAPKPRDLELPQKVEKELQDTRKEAIDKNRAEYEWEHAENSVTPSHIKTMPKEEKDAAEEHWHKEQTFDIVKTAAHLGFSKFIDEITDIFQHDAPFQDYSDVFGSKDCVPAVADRWRDDAEFARQRLQGVLPVIIQRIRALPEKFPVTEEMMAGVLPEGETLAGMLGAGKIYMEDYAYLDGTRAPPERHMVAAIMLFFVNKENVLMPAAIQLGQDPAKFPIFTPAGDDVVTNRWLVAKILCNSSEGCLHEVSNHLVNCHLVMEIVYIALKRTIAPTHPLYDLLGAHFWFTLFINDGARNTLTKDADSAVPKVMAMGFDGMVDLFVKGWKDYTMGLYNIEDNFNARDVNELPGYHYRDDARKVWGSINGYVKKVIAEFYKTDQDVQEDYELQNFVKECIDPAIGNLRGSPFTTGKATTVDEVVLFCTWVIWAATGYHSSLNNGQYDFFGFIPNAPGVFGVPAPGKESTFTLEEVAAGFPDSHMTVYQISFIHVLGMGTKQPVGEMKYNPNYMKGEPKCTELWEEWKKDLKRISGEIKERNKGLEVPYTYLDPDQIADSVSI